MLKQIQFFGKDASSGTVYCQPVWGDSLEGFEKRADAAWKAPNLHPKVREFLKSGKLRSTEEGVYVLVNALGASEYWGCFPAGTLVRLASGEDIPIEEIQEGDEVLTHKNRPRKVTALFRKQADSLVGLRPQGQAGPLWSTLNHPYWIIPRDEFIHLRRKIVYKRSSGISLTTAQKAFHAELVPQWRRADEVMLGDIALLPIPQEVVEDQELLEPGTAELLGWYAAEGCVVRRERSDRPGGKLYYRQVVLTLSAEETESVDEIARICKERGLSPQVYPRYQGTGATRVVISSPKLARLCDTHVGRGSSEKSLSPTILRMPHRWQQVFLDCYSRGDGCIRGPGKGEGSLRISTSSKKLASDVRILLARLGMVASIIPCTQHHTTWGAGNDIFEVSVPAGQLARGKTCSESFIWGEYLACPIKEVHDNSGWSGTVYNFETEEDHSYVAEGVAVHNSNVNGDAFPEQALTHAPPNWEDLSSEGMKKAAKGWKYGFPTFMFAHPFKHHVNKDPSRAFGEVILAVWNPKMHRVEIVVFLDRKKAAQHGAEDVLDRIDRGEFPDVSMGCFHKDAKVQKADGQIARIEEIREGDEVITHKGRLQKVVGTMVRPHKGHIYHVKPYGHREPLVLTEEHPLWLVRKEQTECRPSSKNVNRGRKQCVCTPDSSSTKKGCADCTTKLNLSFEWVRTDKAEEGDYIAIPLPSFPVKRKFAATESRLLGYYLAEGSIERDKKGKLLGVMFSTGLHEDETHKELFALAEEIGARVVERDEPGRGGKYITLWSQSLAQLCLDHCGERSTTKRLSGSLMGADTDTLQLFLGAYANGDGGCYKGAIYLSTASEVLSDQLRIALARVGCIASVNEIVHKPSNLVPKETVEYQVWVGTDTAYRLIGSRHAPRRSKKVHNRRFFYTTGEVTYLMTPIESIEEVEYDDNVYNFEVEEDNSYLVDGLAVHNCKVPYDRCSICNNKSKTKKDYCEHASTMMNKILSDGRKVCVINDFPKFFDISFVFIGADKSAKMLAKLSHVNDMQCMGDFCTVPQPSVKVAEVFSPSEPDEEVVFTADDIRDLLSVPNMAMHKVANDPIKKKVEVRGVPVWIEWLKGETREYKDAKGNVKYRKHMTADYGYIPNTKDSDGEEIDVYVGPDRGAITAYVIKQMKANGKDFDENKVMLGYSSKKKARASYDHHMGTAKERFGGMKAVPVSALTVLFGENGEGKEKGAQTCSCAGSCGSCGGDFSKIAEAFGQKSASHGKTSEIIKTVPAGPYLRAHLPKMEGKLPKKVLKSMAKKAMDEALSSTASMGIVLHPDEFQYLCLTKTAEEELADQLWDNGIVFDQRGDHTPDSTFGYEEDAVDPSLQQELLPFMEDRSIAQPLIEKRAHKLAQKPEQELEAASGDALLEKIAELYLGYRLSLIKKASSIEKNLVSDPHLLSAVAGGSMVEAFAGGIEKTAASVLGPESLAYLEGAHLVSTLPVLKAQWVEAGN